MAFINSWFLFFSLVFFSSCGKDQSAEVVSSGAAASGAAGIAGISGTRWEYDNLNLKIADVFDSSQRNIFVNMGEAWEIAADKNFFNFSTTPNKDYGELFDYLDDGEMGIYRSSGWFDNIGSTALAVNQHVGYKRGTSSYLLHSDIIVNGSGTFGFSFADTVPAGFYDLPTIMLHEIGHFLGLSHNSGQHTVMYPYLKSATANRVLSASDIVEIKSRYPTNTSTVGTGEGVVTYFYGVIELHADGTCSHYEIDI